VGSCKCPHAFKLEIPRFFYGILVQLYCTFRLAHTIVPSFSRPRVSDDNPYIESFFKTLKHTCGYPRCFTTITNAREWFANFINWYNQEHKHSGLQYVTPMQKRTGKHISIFRKRNKILQAAKDKHPERWGCRATKKYSVVNAEVLNPAENKSA